MGSAQTKRIRPRADAAFEDAVRRLREAYDKEEGLVAFLDEVLPEMDRLKSVSQEMAMLGRIGLVSEQSTEYLAGRPGQVVELRELEGRSVAVLAEQAVAAKARRRLYDEPMLSGVSVSELLGSKSRNPRQYANDLRKKGDLLGLRDRNRYVYPSFQFDVARHRIVPGVAEVNRLLGAATDPWGVASWWLSPHGGLEGGTRPADLLESPDGAAAVLRLARIELEPVG